MSGVTFVTVAADEGGQRLDRFLRGRYPGLKQGQLQKLLRTGQVRLDGARAKAGDRVADGQQIRIPPNIEDRATPRKKGPGADMDPAALDRLAADLKARILHLDDDVIAIDKPAGLAVQGGSKTRTHIDGALDRLKLGAAERPRLVHRLDRDTSGVLLLARSRRAAAMLGDAFRARDTQKVYWALVIGVPDRDDGVIDAPLAKTAGARGDAVRVDAAMGKPAKTRLRVIDRAGKEAAWLELQPLSGRTHQLRVHCQAIGTPILGDAKYGPRDCPLFDIGLERRMHLHARRLIVPLPGRADLDVEAPLPPHMTEAWKRLGFDENDARARLEAE